MNGILLINKPLNWTSQDVVNKIRRIFHTKQVGHTGTLDPLATGLLVVLIGNTCKLCDYFVVGTKEYIANIEFGIKTPTLDLESDVTYEENTLHINETQLKKCIKNFIGNLSQIPPMTSAIKVNGIPMYSLAHQGIEKQLNPREIIIKNINILEIGYNNNHFTSKLKIKCSHGTYIRALARDLGTALGTFGTLTKLERISNHIFNIREAINLDTLINSPTPENYVIGEEKLKEIFDYLDLNECEAKTLAYGQYVPINSENKPLPVLTYYNNELIGICRIKDNLIKPKRVFIKP